MKNLNDTNPKYNYSKSIISKLIIDYKKNHKENIGGVISSLRNSTLYPQVYEFLNSFKKTIGCQTITETIYLIYHNLDKIPICPVCNKNHRSFINFKQGYRSGCKECNIKRSRDIISNVKKSLGVDNVMHIETIKNKVVASSKNPEIQKKRLESIKATNLRKYGVECTLQVPEIRQKAIATTLKNHGVSHHMKLESYRQDFHNRMASKENYQNNVNYIISKLDKYGYTLIKPYYNCITPLFLKCKRCNNEFEAPGWNAIETDHNHIETLCKNCFPPKNGISIDEERIYNFFKTKMPSDKIIHRYGSRLVLGDGRELDIYFPDYHIAIEYCGLFTHNSSNPRYDQKPLTNDYHYTKYLLCKEKGIRLFTIFDKRKSETFKEEIFDIIQGRENIDSKSLQLYHKDDYYFYNLDNTWSSYDFFPLSYMFDLIDQHPPVCWFYNDKYHCQFIDYDTFKLSYCNDQEDPFTIAKTTEFNKWYYDCGYQILRLKSEYNKIFV